MTHRAVSIAIVAVVVFFALPILCIVFYGGGAMAFGGLVLLAAMIAIQYPIMRLLVRRKK